MQRCTRAHCAGSTRRFSRVWRVRCSAVAPSTSEPTSADMCPFTHLEWASEHLPQLSGANAMHPAVLHPCLRTCLPRKHFASRLRTSMCCCANTWSILQRKSSKSGAVWQLGRRMNSSWLLSPAARTYLSDSCVCLTVATSLCQRWRMLGF
jgi:hypothetical protein